ncbi:MAG: hypothetical protein QOC62_6029 [Mycobacterium sp.]|jgi:hypothetical protein|nr:hypothetical protein [Mycobacterium sp.]
MNHKRFRRAELIPGDELLDELVTRIGPDEVCREFNVSSIDELRRRLRY